LPTCGVIATSEGGLRGAIWIHFTWIESWTHVGDCRKICQC
jgi:hypothetical protein